jgi:hypothetical protein
MRIGFSWVMPTCANGRRRKTRIIFLYTDEGVITESKEIGRHVVNFYKQLFGSSMHKGVHMSEGFWMEGEKITKIDCLMLVAPFSEQDVERAILGMKVDSAPGPNGFNVTFFRKLWKYINKEIMGMVKNLNQNKLDLKRLNFGVITLSPKKLRMLTQ